MTISTRQIIGFFCVPCAIGKNDDEINALSTGPFAPPFARSLAPFTHSGAHGKEVFVWGIYASILNIFNPLWDMPMVEPTNGRISYRFKSFSHIQLHEIW